MTLKTKWRFSKKTCSVLQKTFVIKELIPLLGFHSCENRKFTSVFTWCQHVFIVRIGLQNEWWFENYSTLVITFASYFTMGKTHGWETFQKCGTRPRCYRFVLSLLFWECPHPRVLSYLEWDARFYLGVHSLDTWLLSFSHSMENKFLDNKSSPHCGWTKIETSHIS